MKRFIILLSLFMISTMSLLADGINGKTQHVHLDAYPDKIQVSAGEEVSILVDMKIDKHWWTYPVSEQMGSTPTEFTVITEGVLENPYKIFSKVPKVKVDPVFESEVEYFKRKAKFVLVMKAIRDIDFSAETIELNCKIQQCDSTTCLDGNIKFTVTPEATPVAPELLEKFRKYDVTYDPEMGYPIATFEKVDTPKEEVKEDKSNVSEAPTAAEEESKGLWSVIVMAMFNGLISIFMPCVFPMIPITVSFFLARSKDGGNGLRDAITYALGIIAVFTLFGALVAVMLKVFNIDILQGVNSPWFNSAIVIIFGAFGLSLLGAFEIQAPTSLTNKIDSKSRSSKGIGSVLLMSVVFALASFSCTGPFISTALVSALEHGSWVDPIVSMIAFSAVLASPFFFLALAPKALDKMQAGAWMNNIKIVLGFIVILMMTKYLNAALGAWVGELPRNAIMALYAGVSLLITLYILGVWRSKHDAPVDSLGTTRIIFAMVFAFTTFYFVAGLSGMSMGFLEGYFPSRSANTAVVSGGSNSAVISWEHDYAASLEKAKAEGKNVFVDFTGISCTNCKKMEGDMFPRATVIAGINEMVPVKLYTDKRGEEYEKNKELRIKKFHSMANPLYVIVTPEGEEIARMNYTSDEKEFTDFLAKGKK